MKGNNISILCTKFLEQPYIDKAAESGITIDTLEFIATTVAVNDDLKQQLIQLSQEEHTVVFTSATAVLAIAKYATPKPGLWKIFCISGTTYDAVKKNLSESIVIGTADNSAHLAEKIVTHWKEKEIIFFSGNLSMRNLPEMLSTKSIDVKEIVVYITTPTPHQVNKQYDGIMFFSPSSVRSFFSANTVNDTVVFFTIGNTTAALLKKFPNPLIVSNTPVKESIINKVISYYKA